MTAQDKPKKQFFLSNQPQKCCFLILWGFLEVSYQPVLEIKGFLAEVLANYLKLGDGNACAGQDNATELLKAEIILDFITSGNFGEALPTGSNMKNINRE